MGSVIQLLQTILYPFGYFLVLLIVYGIARFGTLFFVTTGRLKAFHAIENYWIYLLMMLLSAMIGITVGYGHFIPFCRWFISSLLAGLLGIHFGFDHAHHITDEHVKELEDEINKELEEENNQD